MTKIRRWPEYYRVKKDNEGHPTLSQDAFLSSQLVTKYREKALNEYIELNMLVVHKICKNYRWSNIDYDDLVMYGVEGLIAAADCYDPSKGFKFHTFCYHYILGRLRRALEHHNNLIKIPAHLNLAKLRINHLEEDKEYSDEFLMTLTDDRYSLNDLKKALEIRKLYSIDNLDLIHDRVDESIKNPEIKICIDEILDTLKPLEKQAIELKFGLNGHKPHFYKEVDKILGIDSDGVINRAIVKLRNKGLESLLDYLK